MTTLTKEVWKNTFIFIIALALMILLPAWTIAYWQAWVYLFVFSACIVFINSYFLKYDPKLLQRRLQVGVMAEKEKSQKIIQGFSSLFVIFSVIIPGLDHHFNWSIVPTAVVLFANLLIVIGFFIVFQVFKENSYTAATIDVEKEQRVVTTGPYRIVRHPMYAGAGIAFIASPIALGSWWGVLFSLALLVMMIIRLLDEEKYLSKHLQGYKEYCKKVTYRLFPYIW